MTTGRIYFHGNPWPEGHPVKEFAWTARIDGDQVWFDLHLKTEDYYAERNIDDPEDTDYPSDWAAPNVWGNYHACTMSSTYWGAGGFVAGKLSEFKDGWPDHFECRVDSPPPEELDDNALNIYLLGHDAVADHVIRFTRVANTDTFDIEWSGKIALAYVGNDDYEHAFNATVKGAAAPRLGEALGGRPGA